MFVFIYFYYILNSRSTLVVNCIDVSQFFPGYKTYITKILKFKENLEYQTNESDSHIPELVQAFINVEKGELILV